MAPGVARAAASPRRHLLDAGASSAGAPPRGAASIAPIAARRRGPPVAGVEVAVVAIAVAVAVVVAAVAAAVAAALIEGYPDRVEDQVLERTCGM